MPNIQIVTTSNLFGGHANPIQVMKMADAFSSLGFNVDILLPGWRKKINSLELSERFGVKNEFKISFIPNIFIIKKLFIISFALGSYFKSFKWDKKTIIISRNERAANLLLQAGKKVMYENHTFYYATKNITSKYRKRVKNLMKKKNICMVTISKRLKELWVDYGIMPDKVFVAHDGVDSEDYKKIAGLDKKAIKKKLGLPLEKKTICYVGSLKEDRGIEFILDAANSYKEKDYLFLIIGGSQPEIEKYSTKIINNNVVFTGYIDNSKVPYYLRCADLLVMPYQSSVVTIDGCSPLKVFEYLASGNYILAPKFPSFFEAMESFDGITYYESDNKRKFLDEMDKILQNPNVLSFYDRFKILDEYSWQNRAKKIINIYSQFL